MTEVQSNLPVHIPDTSERIGALEPRRDFGLRWTKEVSGLGFYTAPVDVFATTVDDVTRYDMVIPGSDMAADALLRFLAQVAPSKEASIATSDAVVDDWKLPDRARIPKAAPNYEARLVKMHEKLGPSWRDFMASRKTFLDVLDEPKYPDFQNLFYMCSILEDASDSMHVHNLLDVRSGTLEGMRQTLEDCGFEGAEAYLRHAYEREVAYRAVCDDDPEPAHHTFEQWSGGERYRFLDQLLSRRRLLSGEGIEAKLASIARNTLYDYLPLNGRTFFTNKGELTRPLQESYDARTRKAHGPYTREVMSVEFANGKSAELVVNGSPVRVQEHATITPAITWTVDKRGVRHFLLEQTVPESPTGRVDGVLGVLAVAYFSPSIRKRWPATMQMGKSRKQQIGPAQVPVLALMQREALLRSRVIRVAERVGG